MKYSTRGRVKFDGNNIFLSFFFFFLYAFERIFQSMVSFSSISIIGLIDSQISDMIYKFGIYE